MEHWHGLVLPQTFIVCTTVKKQLSNFWSMALTHCAKKINQSPWPKRFIIEDVEQQTNKIRDSSRKSWHSFGQQFSQWSQHTGSLTPIRRALKKKMFLFPWGLQRLSRATWKRHHNTAGSLWGWLSGWGEVKLLLLPRKWQGRWDMALQREND